MLNKEYIGAVAPILQHHFSGSGISIAELAVRMGTTKQNAGKFSSHLAGQTEPNAPMLFAYAKVLGPKFVEDLADALYRLAMEGIEEHRDAVLKDAERLHKDSQRPRRPLPLEDAS